MHARRGAVVEERDRPVGLFAGVVLPGGGGAGAELEAVVLAPELPTHLAAVGVDVVDGPGVAGVHQEAAVAGHVHGVDVEGVEGGVRGGGMPGVVGARQRHVVEEVPLVADQPGGEVDFLEQRVGDGTFPRPADRREVAVDGVVDGHQGRAVRPQLEFVQVRLVAVARPHDPDLLVGGVVDHPSGGLDGAGHQRVLPPGEHRLAVVALDAQVRGPRSGRERVDQISRPCGSRIIGPNCPVPA